MSFVSFFLIVCVIALIPKEFSTFSNYENELEPMTKGENFDYLILRQIWPQSTCMFPGAHSVLLEIRFSFVVIE